MRPHFQAKLTFLALLISMTRLAAQEPRQLRLAVFPPETQIRAFFPSSPPNGDLLPNNQTVLLRDAGLTLKVRLTAEGFEEKVDEIKLIQTNKVGSSLWEYDSRLRAESPAAFLRSQWHFHPKQSSAALAFIALTFGGIMWYSRRQGQKASMLERTLIEQTATEVQELRERLQNSQANIDGLVLDNYTVGEKIGEGAFSKVYRARHNEFGEEVAIKLLNFEEADRDSVARLKREIDIGATLNHPNIVRTHAFGSFGNYPYVVSELVFGSTLREEIEEERINLERAVALFIQLIEAIAYAHGRGVVHRDLKPANILIAGDDQVKVLDFGLAKLLGASQKLTKTGQAMGTPLYMSPEQLRGIMHPQSDYYSLGCIFFEMVAGKPPFLRDHAMEILSAHAFQKPPRLTELISSAPDHLADLVDSLLAKKPEERASDPEVILEILKRPLL